MKEKPCLVFQISASLEAIHVPPQSLIRKLLNLKLIFADASSLQSY